MNKAISTCFHDREQPRARTAAHAGLERALVRGVLISNLSLGYLPVPKAACTSIKRSLYKLRFGVEYSKNRHSGRDIHKFWDRRLKDISEASFKFVVIRDPVKRFISAYSNKVQDHNRLSESYIKKLVRKNNNIHNQEILFDPSLNQFCERLKDYKTLSGKIYNHTKPFITFFDGDLTFFDRVYKIEDIKSLERHIAAHAEADFCLEHAQSSRIKHSVSELTRDNLDLLIDIYKEDYEFLRDFYSVDAIWAEWKVGQSRLPTTDQPIYPGGIMSEGKEAAKAARAAKLAAMSEEERAQYREKRKARRQQKIAAMSDEERAEYRKVRRAKRLNTV